MRRFVKFGSIGLVAVLLVVLVPALPVSADPADVVIETSAFTYLYGEAHRSGVFWTSPTVGYVIYSDSLGNLKYNKTVSGGAAWGGAVNIRTATTFQKIAGYDCWADWQTAGDAGTKIHIVYADRNTDDIRYVYLDTDGDSVGGDDLIEVCQGTGALSGNSGFVYSHISITKTRGGNLAVTLRYQDSDTTVFYSFYTSPDGDIWTSEASPWEADGYDKILLFPGNETDNQDVWAIFWDASNNEISLKTYDDSGNSWSEQLISVGMYESSSYLQMDGQIRLSDGHLIFAAWSRYNNAASDLMIWDINGAGSIAAKTNVITDTAEYATVSVFVNQVNDDIYIAYIGGTDFTSLAKAFYQRSTDGGANWLGQTALQADAEDDERWISAGAINSTWGGKFQPFWFNDDLNYFYTNTDNGISIAAPAAGPTVTTQAATDVEATTATGNGNITALNNGTCDIRGFVWDLATHGDPGNVAPAVSGYANNVPESNGFGTGPFTGSLTGLPINDTIYVRAYTHNVNGYGYGNEINFLTNDFATVISTAADDITAAQATLHGEITDLGRDPYVTARGFVWDLNTHGDPGNTSPGDSEYYHVGYGSGSFGLGVFETRLNFDPGTTYYWRALTQNSAGWSYSEERSFLTLPAAVNDLSATDGDHTDKVVLTWTLPTGATGVKVYEGVNLLDTLGAVETYDDNAAPAGTVSPGVCSASDGTSATYVTLSLTGDQINDGASRTYKVIVTNATGDSADSNTDEGFRRPIDITYGWFRSAADSDASYAYIGAGANTNPYNDVGGVTYPDGRWYVCKVNATGAVEESSTRDRGYMSAIPTVTNSAADEITGIGADLHGEITDWGDGMPITIGFEWDTDSGVPYANDAHSDYMADIFGYTATDMPPDTTIYWRAYATNVAGTGYSGELSFDTLALPLPGAPTDFALTLTDETITAEWVMGTYATTTVIRRQAERFPEDITDGVEAYSGAGTTFNDTGLNVEDNEYFYRAWSHNDTGNSTNYTEGLIGGTGMILMAEAIFILGLSGLAMWRKNIILYTGAFLCLLLFGLSLIETSWTWALGPLFLSGFMMYQSIHYWWRRRSY